MTHRDEGQIARLVARLRTSSAALVLLHHDAKSGPLHLTEHANVRIVSDPLEVHWGRYSQVHATLKGIEWLTTKAIQFDWLVTLSGQDYPIKPLRNIEAEMRASRHDAFVHHEHIHENPREGERAWHQLCRWRYYGPRHPFRDAVRCFAGSSWLNLSARAVRYVWSRQDLLREFEDKLQEAPSPDETVFQSILKTSPDLAIENSDRRYILWQGESAHPETLTTAHLGPILESNAWFARKMEESVSADLLARLDEMLVGDAPAVVQNSQR